ncbi:hypothetical protein LLH23_02710 [bacterium]|nr:hypothetical protein [bacterium]
MAGRHGWLMALGMCLQVLLVVGTGHGAPAEQAFRSAAAAFSENRALPADAGCVRTWLRCGPAGVQVALTTREGAKASLTLKPFSASLPAAGAATAPTPLPDAGLQIPELRVRRYVRPNPALLKGEARSRVLKAWDTLPSPLTRPALLGFTQSGSEVACTLDGLYCGTALRGGTLQSVRFTLPPGSALGPSDFGPAPEAGFVPVDIRALDQPGALAGASVEPNRARLPVPLLEASAANLDLGATAPQSDLYSDYTNRSAFDALPGSFVLTVPSAQYARAWVLCAVEDDPARDPALTVRLTRFVSGGPYTGRARDCLADTTVALPRDGAAPAAGVTQAGSVTVGGKQRPLYLVEVPLASSDIQDLIFQETPQRGTANIGPYLDLELLGRLRPQDRPHPFGDGRYLPDSRQVSGVHVFGVTLERTPVEMEVRPTQPGNIFCGSEKPEMLVALRPRVTGTYELCWAMRDAAGQPCGGGRKSLSLQAGEAELTVPISLAQPQVGWYAVECSLWQDSRALLTHHAACALLPPDTRQAGFESPYASWWFDHHYGTSDPRIIGPLVLKAGFRRMAYGCARHTEAELAPWKFTAAAVGWGTLRDPKMTDQEIADAIRATADKFPHCGNILLFHESMPNAPLGTRTAWELFRLPVKEYPGADERWAQVTRVARIVRDKFPQLKIYLGNSGASSELIAEGLRRGFAKEYADYVGIETVGRTGHPEKLWEGGLPGVWLLRETVRQRGYPWGVTSCFETNYRQERLLGPQRQAEWYVRDVLLSHAYRFPYISIALLHDVGNSYHGSFWGATGLCRRFPLLYPKPSYVAMATVTRVLDRVTLRREVPTGSNCVYALDFARADGQHVYPVWTARGTCALTVVVRGASRLQVVDLYGRTRPLATTAGKATLTAGTAVQYLVTSGTLASVTCGKRTYAGDQPPAAFAVANAMDKPAQWQLATMTDPLLEQTTAAHLPFRTAGQFSLRGVKDAEKGSCLEVELTPRRDLPTPLLSEYGVLRLKQPVTLPGRPTTLGVWVKGNSGWGQVYWEIEDAAGVRRVSCGTVVHDADVFDYDGRVSVDFDGWAFLSFPITDASPIPDLSTGAVGNLWEATDRPKAVTYPIKLTGVAFSLPQQALHLTEMTPVRQVLRFRDVGAYE